MSPPATLSLPDDEVPDYTYTKLEGSGIRLITLLSGASGDDIYIDITHVPLLPREATKPPLLSVQQLEASLPSGWSVYETVSGRFSFWPPRDQSSITTWEHPVEGFDKSLYIKSTEERESFEPKYEALSYEWGSPEILETVYVRGPAVTKIRIRQNLAWALRHLRHADIPRVLWADAICINQTDLGERAAQILRMANIYRLAQRVLAWLGPAANNSSHALQTLQYLGKQSVTTLKGWRRGTAPDATEPDLGIMTPLPYSRKTWAAISQVLDRGWFQRLWIVQEVQLAQDAVVVCGKATVSWLVFWQAVAFLLWHERSAVVHNLPTHDIDRILFLGSSYVTRPISATISRLLVNKKCTDPRDAIFGLLGLFPEAFRHKINPRYDGTTLQVYLDTVLTHIYHVQRLELLAQCWLEPETLPGSPTWVANFSYLRPPHPEFFEQFASGYSRSWTSHSWDADLRQHLLSVTGVRCATVAQSRCRFPHMYRNIPTMLSVAKMLEPDEASVLKLYPTGEQFGVAHVKTMKGNALRERKPEYRVPGLQRWRDQWKAALRDDNMYTDADDSSEARIERDVWHALNFLKNKGYFETEEGYIGLTYANAQPGKWLPQALCMGTKLTVG